MDDGAPARSAGIDRCRRRFAGVVRCRPGRIPKGSGQTTDPARDGRLDAWPALDDLAKDKSFHGTIICSFVPGLFFAPPGSPPMERAEKGIKRYHNQTPAQRVSEYLAMPLEENIAFLKPDDLSLEALLQKLPIPNRRGA